LLAEIPGSTGARQGLDLDLELRLDQAVHEADLLVDETLVPLDAVENTLEMHPAVAPAKGLTIEL